MSREEVLNRVVDMLRTITDAEDIHEESELIDELEISSMDIIYMVSCMEAEFGIKIKAREIHRMYTVGDIAKVVMSLLE